MCFLYCKDKLIRAAKMGPQKNAQTAFFVGLADCGLLRRFGILLSAAREKKALRGRHNRNVAGGVPDDCVSARTKDVGSPGDHLSELAGWLNHRVFGPLLPAQ